MVNICVSCIGCGSSGSNTDNSSSSATRTCKTCGKVVTDGRISSDGYCWDCCEKEHMSNFIKKQQEERNVVRTKSVHERN